MRPLMPKPIFAVGEVPDLGVLPERMHAQLIRQSRFGEPRDAFAVEEVSLPELGPRDVLVYVMAAGVNYNNVWAALGLPIDVIKTRQKAGEKEDFHIGGSDASGVVWAVGNEVENVKVGDDVVLHCGVWDPKEPHIVAGKDPMLSSSQRIWGYETNWGSFAQFTRVQDHQCLPKPPELTWEEAAAYMLVGATAYRMLHGWPPNVVTPGDVVLVWGAAGGLGSMAIQLVNAAGGRAVGVVNSSDKFDYVKKLGAAGVLNRKEFHHWGMLPHWTDEAAYGEWVKGARGFGKAIWDSIGEKKSPSIVFEHPGESTVPTSIFVCETGGMVVICAGTTGYNATLDLRYHWMRQKRFQGSHFANDVQAKGVNDLVTAGKVDACLSRVFPFAETGACHQLMRENAHPNGNMAILVNAPKPGLRTLAEARAAR
jgi:crotonyl-CoA carboxylase/reductase